MNNKFSIGEIVHARPSSYAYVYRTVALPKGTTCPAPYFKASDITYQLFEAILLNKITDTPLEEINFKIISIRNQSPMGYQYVLMYQHDDKSYFINSWINESSITRITPNNWEE